MKNLMVGVLRILICVAIGVELIGCFCINSLMFHPVRHYDESYPGYVDIGTDGTKIAALTSRRPFKFVLFW